MAVEHAVRHSARARGRTPTLGKLTQVLREFSDPSLALRRINEETLRIIPAAHGAAVELVEDGGLRCVCAAGSMEAVLGMRFPIDGSLSGLAVQLGATLRTHDASRDPRLDSRAAKALGAVSVICVPLRCTGRAVGALNVASRRPNAFSDRDVATLARLSAFMTALVTAAAAVTAATGELLSPATGSAGTHTAPPADPDETAMSGFVLNVLRPGTLAELQAASQIEQVLTKRLFRIVYQPIVRIDDGATPMVEALCRFAPEPYRTPDHWFADAWRSGFGAELELAAIEQAATELETFPAGTRLAVNLSPPAIAHPHLAELLDAHGPERFVIELTEHVVIDDYPAVREALLALGKSGVRVAIDDTGAGYASLTHILKLAPDIIKLDRELIHDIDTDPVRRSLATCLAAFAADIGAEVVAEAVETQDELRAVCELGIRLVQGYLIAPPGDADSLRSAFRVAS